MGIFRYWLKGEHDEIDKDWLVINMYNKRRKLDSHLKSWPRGENFPLGVPYSSPEWALVGIYEAYLVLTSWGVGTAEALARIETYRRRFPGSGQFRSTYDLKDYIGYRLSIESKEWLMSPKLSDLLISSGIDRCQKFFAKFPPGIFIGGLGRICHATSIAPNSLLAPIDDPSAVPPYLQLYLLNGDRIWSYDDRSDKWYNHQGYALVRGETIVKAVCMSARHITQGAIEEVPPDPDRDVT